MGGCTATSVISMVNKQVIASSDDDNFLAWDSSRPCVAHYNVTMIESSTSVTVFAC